MLVFERWYLYYVFFLFQTLEVIVSCFEARSSNYSVLKYL